MSTPAAQTFADLGIAVRANGRTQQRLRCPNCGRSDHDDTLGANLDNGKFHCFRCGWKGRVLTAGPSLQRTSIEPLQAIADRKRERLLQVWRESVLLDDLTRAQPVRTYLESRALGRILHAPLPGLRAHPGLEYWDGKRSLGRFPAMVAQITGRTGEMVSLHVTYLHPSGRTKAEVPSAKKILPPPVSGSTAGGTIQLYEAVNGELGIAEGIESALSLHILREGLPVWSAICADNLSRIRLPAGLRELAIGVDLDANGTGCKAAEKLAMKTRDWSPGTRITFCLPDINGVADLNDELQAVACETSRT